MRDIGLVRMIRRWRGCGSGKTKLPPPGSTNSKIKKVKIPG